MGYAMARFAKQSQKRVLQVYVTDCLYALVNGGQTMTKRYIDLIRPESPEEAPDEIISRIKGGLEALNGCI